MIATADPIRRKLLSGGAILGGALLAAAGARARRIAPRLDSSAMRPIAPPPQHGAAERVAHLADVDLWYWDTGGTGEPIVLLHPLTGSGHVWEYQQPVLAQAGYRVIGYSRRGFRGSSVGASDRPGTGADDLLALADHLGLDRFHAVGTAGGAFVAAAFATLWPTRLRTLTLACTIVGAAGAPLAALVDGLALRDLNALPADLRELGPSYRAVNPEGHARWLALERTSRTTSAPIRQAAGPVMTLDALAALRVPTLLMAGDADLIAPPPIARLFARTIPHAELVILTECGHSGYWERPDQFNQALLDFIGRHGRRRSPG